MVRAALLALTAATALAACGDDGHDDDHDHFDAAATPDAAAIDADPGAPDADPTAPDAAPAPDAAVSSVQVVDCGSATNPVELTTNGFAFSPAGTLNVPVNGYVRFTPVTTANHNVASPPDAPADKTFSSGTPGHDNIVCFQFTATGSYPFRCDAHPGMTGTFNVQ